MAPSVCAVSSPAVPVEAAGGGGEGLIGMWLAFVYVVRFFSFWRCTQGSCYVLVPSFGPLKNSGQETISFETTTWRQRGQHVWLQAFGAWGLSCRSLSSVPCMALARGSSHPEKWSAIPEKGRRRSRTSSKSLFQDVSGRFV